ncbi:30S ribosomal protein S4 [Candidatus Falkowbacteria bacterium RIFOXYD2_FULL_35_9]|uniref:Small ribosomal subunit protein uS4 n=1 Tax=Candidatus Falkowbacteria bacterium RIFOXYC2_FULL_36_12 TaxID=1798002 RepID=A0A1F5SZ00_9BACT|nr:MAG: 30S ribosomal protein S4 [Candidatus Falkowbacteria bacterium RIFOXYB2_FULL_35_7]OGF31716.1 MAG: 30S ribosomal protein S4 [Candidatus Falkowbacteria bacterium RIFOXYC2_FULL_36_12]OGF33159.1 MAG: 30S ribosomal protein S4 [Candidatus Falkowbacteria bacterium RIFOXYA2_FULL_35_8]OGF46195.1 MAG: 30S ribosomal protein S4 [Candidatus Falkowbacteria bacterium RIFOXYD2_FULL_35_9]
MSENQNAKCRICRRTGKKLYLKDGRCDSPNCAITRRSYGPGIQGPKQTRARLTDFGKQLREKQSAKSLYNLREKQFKNYFDKAIAQKAETTGQALYRMLEMRLDNVVHKLGYGKSIKHSRQLVSHGHFMVNGKKVDIPSYQLKVNDVITVREKSIKNRVVFNDLAERLKNHELANWLFVDPQDMSGKVVSVPDSKKFALDFDMKSIVEFYSR